MAEIGIRFGNEIAAAARRHGLDPRLLAAVAAQETGGPGATSGRNVVGDGGHGHGVFQIDDRSSAFAKSAAAMDPARNADVAAGMLARDLAGTHGDVREALSIYNAGSPHATGTTTTWGDGRTLGYADSVLRHQSELGGIGDRLIAESRETSSSVNALANFNAGSTSSASTTAPDPALATPPLTVPTDGTQLSPVRSWASISGDDLDSANAPGHAADAGIASIISGDDVFDAESVGDG